MTSVAEVRLWGRSIGAVAFRKGDLAATFEYKPEFADSGIQVAPLMMPLSRRIYTFPYLPAPAFHQLPGLLSDSLPDRFGNTLINVWLAREGRPADSLSAIERLCYTGQRGMGALEYVPDMGPKLFPAENLDIAALVQLASEVLQQRENMHISFDSVNINNSIRQILSIGTSAGGARAKAVIAWNPTTQEVRSGQGSVPEGFEHWLLKFDGVQANRDKELTDKPGYGAIEYAYYLMASAAGVTMQPSRLLEEGPRRHFMTKRFDRGPQGQKIHMQSLGALGHFDYNAPGVHSYEEVIQIMKTLQLSLEEQEQLYRRMVFNILARNQDDHVKNISFLMNKQGLWSLAPAYDMTYSYQHEGVWTGQHQMSVNGKRDQFTREDLLTISRQAGFKRNRGVQIIEEVGETLQRWSEFAEQAGVPELVMQAIQSQFRMYLLKK